MPCDFCPTHTAPGRWSSLVVTSASTRSVQVLCPDCTTAAVTAAESRKEEQASAELVERVASILRGAKLTEAAAAELRKMADIGKQDKPKAQTEGVKFPLPRPSFMPHVTVS